MRIAFQLDFVALVAAALGFVTVIFAFRARRGVMKLALSIASAGLLIPGLLLAAAFHPEWIDARYRTYKALYGDIEIGMTREQVLACLEARYPETGPRLRPTVVYDEPARLGFFMNPESSHEPNCEGILLELSYGRISQKRYSSD